MADRTSRQAAPPGAPRRAVRRNLFQGLTRRPTGPTAAAAATAGGAPGSPADALRLDVDVLSDGGGLTTTGGAGAGLMAQQQLPVEIVVRDEHGEIELGELPTLVFDEADEAALDDREESKKERQRLAEAVKQHQVAHPAAVRDQPEELLEAVRASLRAKVAALAEDNWMYEAEPEPPRGF
ncbi:upf0220 domain protein [Colletotrichum musicola]|uniref:Upf0220 domain protein n=1 Tax=Colletotrichum musicola TaxID=2175873 RepID=A0A8H6NLW0_9PEZI|nr:upf0220 domain protein [Colletotrichum musicola]